MLDSRRCRPEIRYTDLCNQVRSRHGGRLLDRPARLILREVCHFGRSAAMAGSPPSNAYPTRDGSNHSMSSLTSNLKALRPALPVLTAASLLLSVSMGLRQSLGIFLQPLTHDIGI